MILPAEGSDAKTTIQEDDPMTRVALEAARAFVLGTASERDMMQALSLARATRTPNS